MSTTYYHDDAVHITSGGVHVGGAWYPLSTFTYVWHRRTGRLRHGAYLIASRTAALGVLVARLVGGGMAARNGNGSGEQKQRLSGGGEETMIYSTTDSTRFGQIYRALQRAIENGS